MRRVWAHAQTRSALLRQVSHPATRGGSRSSRRGKGGSEAMAPRPPRSPPAHRPCLAWPAPQAPLGVVIGLCPTPTGTARGTLGAGAS